MVDTATLIKDQLTALGVQVADKYRPKPFRRILNVKPVVPTWATQGSFFKVQVSSDMKLTSAFDSGVPLASHKRVARYFPIVEAANGYRIFRDEIQRAQQEPGYQLDPTLAAANQRAAESMVSELCMRGTFKGVAVPGMNGLLTMSDATDITSSLTAFETWVDASGVINETSWANIIKFVDEMIANYRLVAGDEITPDFFGIPDWQWKALIARDTTTKSRVIDDLRTSYPSIEFLPLREGNEVSASGVDRFALWSRDEEVQTAVVPEEYHDLDPVNEPLGAVMVPSILKCGGCISNFPQGIMFADMDRTDV